MPSTGCQYYSNTNLLIFIILPGSTDFQEMPATRWHHKYMQLGKTHAYKHTMYKFLVARFCLNDIFFKLADHVMFLCYSKWTISSFLGIFHLVQILYIQDIKHNLYNIKSHFNIIPHQYYHIHVYVNLNCTELLQDTFFLHITVLHKS